MDPTTIVDLSHPLVEQMPCYPGDPGYKMALACCVPLIDTKSTSIGETNQPELHMAVRVHALSLGTHTGTHVDAPFHFFPSGQKLHEIPLAQFIGRAVVLDVRHLARERGQIRWADMTNNSSPNVPTVTALSHIGPRTAGKADIVLLWTGWDVHWGAPTYFAHPYFSRDVADALHALGARIVGVDTLSPDETPADENAATEGGWGMHAALLGRGVLICENLRGLGKLGGGEETWVGLIPMSVHGGDGAPVRACGWKRRPGVAT